MKQYAIFQQRYFKRKNDTKSSKIVIIRNNNYPFSIPNGIICELPFVKPHPKDKNKRLFYTPIQVNRESRRYGTLVTVVSSPQEVFEAESQKDKFILEAFAHESISRIPRATTLVDDNDILRSLNQAHGCLLTLKEIIKDKDYIEVALKLFLPSLNSSLSSLVEVIQKDLKYKKNDIAEIEKLMKNSPYPPSEKTLKATLVDKSFVHQVNKTLLGLDIEDLPYYMANKMDTSIDEVIFLSINATNRLKQMFKDYNNYSFDRTIRMEKNLTTESLHILLNSYKHSLIAKDHNVYMEVEEYTFKNKFFYTDFNILSEVIETILYNAIEAVDKLAKDRNIYVSFEEDEKYIIINIEDNGSGFDLSNGEDKFFQIGFTTKTRNTGLGLAISKEFMNKIGGDVHIQNSTKLNGAKMVIYVPIHYSLENLFVI